MAGQLGLTLAAKLAAVGTDDGSGGGGGGLGAAAAAAAAAAEGTYVSAAEVAAAEEAGLLAAVFERLTTPTDAEDGLPAEVAAIFRHYAGIGDKLNAATMSHANVRKWGRDVGLFTTPAASAMLDVLYTRVLRGDVAHAGVLALVGEERGLTPDVTWPWLLARVALWQWAEPRAAAVAAAARAAIRSRSPVRRAGSPPPPPPSSPASPKRTSAALRLLAGGSPSPPPPPARRAIASPLAPIVTTPGPTPATPPAAAALPNGSPAATGSPAGSPTRGRQRAPVRGGGAGNPRGRAAAAEAAAVAAAAAAARSPYRPADSHVAAASVVAEESGDAAAAARRQHGTLADPPRPAVSLVDDDDLPGTAAAIVARLTTLLSRARRAYPAGDASQLLEPASIDALHRAEGLLQRLFVAYTTARDSACVALDWPATASMAADFALCPGLVSKPTLFGIFVTVSPTQVPILFPGFLELMGRLALTGFGAPALAPLHPTAAAKLDALADRILAAADKLVVAAAAERARGRNPAAAARLLSFDTARGDSGAPLTSRRVSMANVVMVATARDSAPGSGSSDRDGETLPGTARGPNSVRAIARRRNTAVTAVLASPYYADAEVSRSGSGGGGGTTARTSIATARRVSAGAPLSLAPATSVPAAATPGFALSATSSNSASDAFAGASPAGGRGVGIGLPRSYSNPAMSRYASVGGGGLATTAVPIIAEEDTGDSEELSSARAAEGGADLELHAAPPALPTPPPPPPRVTPTSAAKVPPLWTADAAAPGGVVPPTPSSAAIPPAAPFNAAAVLSVGAAYKATFDTRPARRVSAAGLASRGSRAAMSHAAEAAVEGLASPPEHTPPRTSASLGPTRTAPEDAPSSGPTPASASFLVRTRSASAMSHMGRGTPARSPACLTARFGDERGGPRASGVAMPLTVMAVALRRRNQARP